MPFAPDIPPNIILDMGAQKPPRMQKGVKDGMRRRCPKKKEPEGGIHVIIMAMGKESVVFKGGK
jgi:hypothetical protein|tara:strand:+ start:4038 stop:4229 length:192 start_codon:yes stop_codon:yes gene_type:complete